MRIGGGVSYRRFLPAAALCAGVLAALLALSVPAQADAAQATLKGQVKSGKLPLRRTQVTLYRHRAKAGRPVALGSARTGRRGGFALRYRVPRNDKYVLYAIARRGRYVALATVLGTKPVGPRIAINERTTVAAGSSEAQFLAGRRLIGPYPGPQNATKMASNLAHPRTGALSRVISTPPNGRQTTARRTLNSLANMVARCVRSARACRAFLKLTTPRGERAPRTTLQALVNIARDPSHNRKALYRYARGGRPVYRPERVQSPDTWTVILRFDGDGMSMDGPGNFAIDSEGSLWVVNNYEYSPNRRQAACAGDTLLRFTPDGRYYPGSPYTGGGLSGAGYGVTIDTRSRVWVGNFGFSAPPPYCPDPPANSVSLFSPGGKVRSPADGYVVGGIDWPQGMASDRDGNVWVANCGYETTPGGNISSVTRIEDGNPAKATNISGIGIYKGFGIAINHRGRVFAGGNRSNSVAILNPNGTPAPGSPVTTGGIKAPMGLASDSRGYVWVANSQVVDPPCPPPVNPALSGGGTLTLLGLDGRPVRELPFKGGGLRMPWGITVDGDDNVWVGNFSGQRLSKFCGTRPKTCPAGRQQTGKAISPPKTGYGFEGLVRITGVAVDPSGNVWAANNWKRDPATPTEDGVLLLNPGGYEIVAYIGAAAPIKTPTIGTPTPLLPRGPS